MRQYIAKAQLYGQKKTAQLKPTEEVDLQLMNHSEVKKAVEVMRDNPAVVALSVQAGLSLVGLLQFDQPAEAPSAFCFDREYSEIKA